MNKTRSDVTTQRSGRDARSQLALMAPEMCKRKLRGEKQDNGFPSPLFEQARGAHVIPIMPWVLQPTNLSAKAPFTRCKNQT